MHELSLAGEILRMVQAAEARDHFCHVATLKLEAGALAGVEVSALRFAIDALVPGTCLEGAQILIDEPPGQALCSQCAQVVSIVSRSDSCPLCDGHPLKVVGGDALRVVDLLVLED